MRNIAEWHVKKAPTWRGEQNTRRSDQCRAWLGLYGYITDAENAKIKARILKDRAQADVAPASPSSTRRDS